MALVVPAVHINSFYAEYPTFDYNPAAGITSEFRRLCAFQHWTKKSFQRLDARSDLQLALVLQFNAFYGTNVEDVQSWRNLCQVLKVDPIPNDIVACRKVCGSRSSSNR